MGFDRAVGLGSAEDPVLPAECVVGIRVGLVDMADLRVERGLPQDLCLVPPACLVVGEFFLPFPAFAHPMVLIAAILPPLP